jgi:D-tyrosyl-tRNA(Tyr) deacylase
MKVVVQRVSEASVTIDGAIVSKIDRGLLVLFGVHVDDDPAKTAWFVNKLLNLRIFEDENGKMNRSVLDIEGGVLAVSQFTLYGNCMNGRRPDFISAAAPDKAEKIYDKFVSELKSEYPKVGTGVFGAKMSVALTNDGPVTLVIE